MQPLKQPENSLLCDPSLVDEIFNQIPELLEHHEQFLEQVRHCVQTWHAQQKVGDLLVQSVSGPALHTTAPATHPDAGKELSPGRAQMLPRSPPPLWRPTLIPDPAQNLSRPWH